MKNQLSALIDGELDPQEAEHLFTALKVDAEMKEAWRQYHLIGDVLRGSVDTNQEMAAKIMLALDDEPTVLGVNKQLQSTAPNPNKKTFQTKFFWSIAASVAAVMFVGLMVFELELSGSEEMRPIELANSLPMEYLQAHQSMAPSSAAYYIQSANFTESE